MKKILSVLLIFVVSSISAFMPPPQSMEGITWQYQYPLASFAGLPTELKTEILRYYPQHGKVLNIPALANGLTAVAGASKVGYKLKNDPQNMLAILKSIPKAGAVILANGLKNMPVMKSKEVDAWLKSFTLENGKALYDAINKDHPDLNTIANILKNPNIDVNFKIRTGWTTGWTPLMMATDRGYTDIVKLLLSAGANVNSKNNHSLTSLWIAIDQCKTDIAALLIEAGADLNEKYGASGMTPLMLASYKGRIDIVRKLLEAGADVNKKSDDDRTALQYARDRAYMVPLGSCKELIKLLEDALKSSLDK